jgi:6-phosphogluconolactonase
MLIDPTGQFLLVGNMKSDEVVVFKRDMQSGQLTAIHRFSVPRPACLKMTAR